MMSADVIDFPGVTLVDWPSDRTLDKAKAAELSDVVVIGWTKAGKFYFGSNKSSGPEALWLLELARKKLVEIGSPD